MKAPGYLCEGAIPDGLSTQPRPCGRAHAKWIHAARRYLCEPCVAADLERRAPHCPHAPDGPSCAWCREALGLPSAAPPAATITTGATRGPASPPAFPGYDPVAIVAASLDPAPDAAPAIWTGRPWAGNLVHQPAVVIGAAHAPRVAADAAPEPSLRPRTAAGVPIVDHGFVLAPDAPEPETCVVCGFHLRAQWHVAPVFGDPPQPAAASPDIVWRTRGPDEPRPERLASLPADAGPLAVRAFNRSVLFAAVRAVKMAETCARQTGRRLDCLTTARTAIEGALRNVDAEDAMARVAAARKCDDVVGGPNWTLQRPCNQPATRRGANGYALCDVHSTPAQAEFPDAGLLREAMRLAEQEGWRP